MLITVCVATLFLVFHETNRNTLLQIDRQSPAIRFSKPFRAALSSHRIICALLSTACNNEVFNMIMVSLGVTAQRRYHLILAYTGVPYLVMGVASSGALMLAPKMLRFAKSRAAVNPDINLALLLISSPLSVIGLLSYGWGAQHSSSWLFPLLGLASFGFGTVLTRLGFQLFILDTVTTNTVSSMAAFAVANCWGGSLLPLGIFPLYERMGYGMGNTILAGALAVIGIVALALCMHCPQSLDK
ncbi:hypothetical protein GQ44DRAFT_801123, partial [Phaeosphaeriaceae sp. PMI808]